MVQLALFKYKFWIEFEDWIFSEFLHLNAQVCPTTRQPLIKF